MQVEKGSSDYERYPTLTHLTYLSKALSFETDMEIVAALLNLDPLATSNLPWVSLTSHLNAENFYTTNGPNLFIIEMKNYDLPRWLYESLHRPESSISFAARKNIGIVTFSEAFQLLHPYLVEQGHQSSI